MHYGPVNVTTAVLLGFALWVMFTRVRGHDGDNNWPVIFYPVIILFAFEIPGRIEPNAIVAGLATSLVARFEFVGGAFAKLLKAVELLTLGAITYYLVNSLMY